MVYEKEKKEKKLFVCDSCDYHTSDKTKYTVHILTRKHQNGIQMVYKKEKKSETEKSKYKCGCGNVYSYRSGLYRHQRTCEIFGETTLVDNKILLNELKKEIKEELTEEFKKEMKDQVLQNITNITNVQKAKRIYNKQKNINIQVFLNEQCKDAISISSFVESIKPTLEDLEKVGEIGYVRGMVGIILSKLKELDVYTRPIHCSDLKKETIYVNDGQWENNDHKVTKFVKNIANKNIRNIREWKNQNPEHDNIQSGKNSQYLKMIQECVGGEDEAGNNQKIIKRISHDILIS